MNILILGDGNYSFSKSFQQKLYSNQIHYNLLHLTSYDTVDELSQKYPETKGILQYLLSQNHHHHQIKISYSVDVTKSLKYLLHEIPAQLKGKEEGESVEEEKEKSSDSFKNFVYNFIIFNFPHIGIENSLVHSSMMGHMLHQVSEILDENGIFYLTLADDQPINWKLDEMCRRNKFVIHHTLPFNPNDWSGYEMRRHQIGKSFHQRTQRFTTFALVHDIPKSDEISQNISNGLFEQLLHHPQMSSSCLLKTESTTKSGEKKTSKKRKVTELTHGRYSQITGTSTDQLTSSQYQCNECQKVFSSEQGVKTHVYMTHILNSSKENIELPSLQCTLCFPTRTFPNEDALFQHNRSRHSQLSIPIPSVVTCPSSSQISTEPDECPICGLHLETSFEEHLNSIIPSEPISLQCSLCHKIFHTERSLRQHLNFCSLSLPVSSENHDKTVELTDNVESF